jgi:hypothetical protein
LGIINIMNRMAYLLLVSNWKSRSTEASNEVLGNRPAKNLFSKKFELAAILVVGRARPTGIQIGRLRRFISSSFRLNRPISRQIRTTISAWFSS